jgi:hypothetical protein
VSRRRTRKGFVDVETVDSKSDLNVWKAGYESNGAAMTCCASVAPIDTDLDLNAYVGSFKISARKP